MTYRAKRYTRAELDTEARRLGLDPQQYRNKDLLTEALNELAARDPSVLPLFKIATCNASPLKQGFTRQEADSYAQKLGLDPSSYANKREVCTAINSALDGRSTPVRAQSPVLPVRIPEPVAALPAAEVAPLPFTLRLTDSSSSSINDWRPFPLQTDKSHCGYEVDKKLGQGGYGTVYNVGREGRTYALKTVKSDIIGVTPEMMIEAYVLAHARHPHIIPARDIFFECNERLSDSLPRINFLLEVADQGSLSQWLKSPHTIDEKLQLVQQVVSGVAFLHRHNVVHADIKPGNVLVHQGKAWLADFSLSQRWTGKPLTRKVQTIFWRAPEIIFRDYGLPSDMWAIGALMWDIFQFDLQSIFGFASAEDDESALMREIMRIIGKPSNWPPAKHQAKYDQLMKGATFPKPKVGISIPSLKDDPRAIKIWTLFNRCLTFDPAERITAAEFLQSPIFANMPNVEGYWVESGSSRSLTSVAYNKVLYSWLRETQLNYKHLTSTLALAIDIVERSLVVFKQPVLKDLQLLGIASYSLAAAMNEEYPISASRYAWITDNAYTVATLLAAQSQICQALQFQLWPDNWPVICTDLAVQESVILRYAENTLSPDLVKLYTERRYAELCRSE